MKRAQESTFNENLELLLTYLWSNIRNFKFDQLQESVNDALEEGGAIMGTIYQEVLEKGKEIGVKEGEEKNKLRVALNCIIKGMDNQAISEITDLPVERIELLRTAARE